MSRGLLPSGPYLLTVVTVGEPRTSQSGNQSKRIDLQLVGTDVTLYWFCGDAKTSEWAYRDVVKDWNHLEELTGRTFLFNVFQETLNDRTRNRVKPPPIAEVK
jgi:hypothetical protein